MKTLNIHKFKNIKSLTAGLLGVALMLTTLNFREGYSQEMVYIQGGTFKMGNEKGYKDEMPVHNVKVNSFFIGKYEVTTTEYREFCKATRRVMPAEPVWGWHDKYPITGVNWNDADSYCKWLSKKTGKKYRLPTEAEWEYAARGGKRSKGYTYSGSNNEDEVSWYDETTDETGPRQVGSKKPNELGIYDMSGNVWEWCSDIYNHEYYKKSPYDNPQGALKPPQARDDDVYRVLRGGSWYYEVSYSRVTARDGPKSGYSNKNYGFRVVRAMK